MTDEEAQAVMSEEQRRAHSLPGPSRRPTAGPGPREALAIVLRRDHLRRTLMIALLVGCVLTVINQLDVFVSGSASTGTFVKTALNFCVPFVVSNLGLLAGKRT